MNLKQKLMRWINKMILLIVLLILQKASFGITARNLTDTIKLINIESSTWVYGELSFANTNSGRIRTDHNVSFFLPTNLIEFRRWQLGLYNGFNYGVKNDGNVPNSWRTTSAYMSIGLHLSLNILSDKRLQLGFNYYHQWKYKKKKGPNLVDTNWDKEFDNSLFIYYDVLPEKKNLFLGLVVESPFSTGILTGLYLDKSFRISIVFK